MAVLAAVAVAAEPAAVTEETAVACFCSVAYLVVAPGLLAARFVASAAAHEEFLEEHVVSV